MATTELQNVLPIFLSYLIFILNIETIKFIQYLLITYSMRLLTIQTIQYEKSHCVK